MSVDFLLIRHALKEKAMGDVPITSNGREQAQATARFLRSLPITAIVSSPLRRAQETAAYLASETGSAVRVDARLRERANWGDLPGQSFEEFVRMWERSTREPEYIPPVGDSARQACDRMASLLRELAEEYPPGSLIVIVTHGGLITDYLANTFSESALNRFQPDFIARQSDLISECSITKLNCDNGNYKIESFASIEHLNANEPQK